MSLSMNGTMSARPSTSRTDIPYMET